MNKEIEILFYDIDKDLFRKKMKEIGAQKVYDEFLQRRMVFDFGQKEGLFSWARVRQESDKIVMSYKETKKDEFAKEIEVEVSDFDNAVNILTFSGLQPSSYQENYREKYTYKNSEIVIDTWPWLEAVVEVESPNEKELREIIEALGLDEGKSFKGSINNVYKVTFGKYIQDLTNEQQMKITFEKENQFLL